MRKFILIDQSIKGKGGHYLEYAMNVLDASKDSEYAPCVAVNKTFREKIKYNCYKVFKYDVWGEHDKRLRMLLSVRRAFGRLSYKKKMLTARFTFSKPGYLLELFRQKELSLFLENINRAILILAVLISPVLLFFFIIWKLVRLIFRIISIPLRMFARFSCKIAAPFRIENWRKLGKAVSKKKQVKHFKKSVLKTLKHFNAAEGDIIFIPTLSVVDLSAIASLVSESAIAQAVSWHLVFRRNLFVGREPNYSKTDKDFLGFRRVMLKMNGDVYSKVFFYTDTSKLSEQHNLMNTVKFHTLPIPVNPQFLEHADNGFKSPLNIVYLGDARREKGYGFLPNIVEELWEEYVLTGKVAFDFQSNFSFSDMKANYDIVFSRNTLEAFNSKHVKLRKKPLDVEQYVSFVKSGDIGLLFFDRDNYYARSSGTFVECMQTAMPVIVPSGSWLSEHVAIHNYLHLSGLRSSMTVIKEYAGEDLDWRASSEDEDIDKGKGRGKGKDTEESSGQLSESISPMQDGELSFSNIENAAHVRITPPTSAGYMFISFCTNELNPKGSFVKTHVKAYNRFGFELSNYESDDASPSDEDVKVCIVFELPGDTSDVRIQFSNAFCESNISIKNVGLCFVNTSTDNVPFGSFGLCYARIEDVPYLLKNIINNFKHYKSASRSASVKWHEAHNANQLVSCLGGNAAEKRGAAHA